MSESSEVPINRPEMSTQVKEYFKGRELPTHVRARQGTAYYLTLEDINPDSFRARRRDEAASRIDGFETRGLVVNEICHTEKDEPPDANFKFVGERGLYVRVEVEEYDKTKDPKIRWMPFNEDDVKPGKIRFT